MKTKGTAKDAKHNEKEENVSASIGLHSHVWSARRERRYD
jgi:hypothetical protein